MSDSPHPVIKSRANPKIRRLIKLRDNRTRRQSKCVIVDGWRETSHAIQSGLRLCGLYLTPEEYRRQLASSDELAKRSIEQSMAVDAVFFVSESLLEKIAFGQSPRGVVAEFHEPESALSTISLSDNPLILVLDRIEKPGNLGAIFRSADAAGVDAILLCECTDCFNPNAIRNSQGAVFHVPKAKGSQSDISEFLSSRRIQLFSARVESSSPLWRTNLSGPAAIIFGNEADGLGTRWQDHSEVKIDGIQIPMIGKVDSLNVSVTAAIIAMEAARQRSAM